MSDLLEWTIGFMGFLNHLISSYQATLATIGVPVLAIYVTRKSNEANRKQQALFKTAEMKQLKFDEIKGALTRFGTLTFSSSFLLTHDLRGIGRGNIPRIETIKLIETLISLRVEIFMLLNERFAVSAELWNAMDAEIESISDPSAIKKLTSEQRFGNLAKSLLTQLENDIFKEIAP